MKSLPGTLAIIGTVLLTVPNAADLNLAGQSNRTVDGGSYGRLIIRDASSITVRNCTFTASGTAGPADIRGSRNVLIENCDFDGNTDACNAMHISNSADVTIRNCTLHDAADDGIETNGVTRLTLEGNTIAHLYGCGTDNGCGPCYNGHSDGIELINVDGVTMTRNLVYDVRSTGAVFMGGGNTFCRNLVMTNNIFYVPENAIAVYVQNVAGAALYNNIIWKGHWHGLAIGPKTTGLTVKNNIIRSIDFTHLGGTYDAAQHDIDYNLISGACQGYELNTHDVWDPYQRFATVPNIYYPTVYTDVEPGDFDPVAAANGVDAGWSGMGVPGTDFYGNPRSGSGTDIGAIESAGAAGVRHPAVRDNGTGIRIIPNPVRGAAHITCGNEAGNGRLSVYATDGRPVRTFLLQPGTAAVWHGYDDAGNKLPRGTYLTVSEHAGVRVTGTVFIK